MARQATRKQSTRKPVRDVMPPPVPTASHTEEISELWKQVAQLIDYIIKLQNAASNDNGNAKKA